MRTTVTLDADVEAVLRRLMVQRGVSFNDFAHLEGVRMKRPDELLSRA